MGPNFDYNVDPGPMKQAMFTFTDRATQMLEESVNYAVFPRDRCPHYCLIHVYGHVSFMVESKTINKKALKLLVTK